MNERLRNIARHPLTHIALMGLTGLPLACARPAETYNIDGAITIPQATALAKMEPSRNASTNTTSATTQAIENQSFPQQTVAMEKTVEFLWQMFDRSSGESDSENGFFFMAIAEANRKRVALDIASGKPSQSPDDDYFLVHWTSTWNNYSVRDATNPRQQIYNVGIGSFEVQNFRTRVLEAPQLTTADQANGLTWKGKISVEYIRRLHGLIGARTDTMPEFRVRTDSNSSWKDDKTNFDVSQVKGSWIINLENNVQPPIPIRNLAELHKKISGRPGPRGWYGGSTLFNDCRPPAGCLPEEISKG